MSPERENKRSFQYMGHHLHKNLDIFMEYTGKILIGKGFIKKYHIYMGCQRARAYEVLEGSIFDKGQFVKAVDHSEMAKKVRAGSWEPEMKDKAWWIG